MTRPSPPAWHELPAKVRRHYLGVWKFTAEGAEKAAREEVSPVKYSQLIEMSIVYRAAIRALSSKRARRGSAEFFAELEGDANVSAAAPRHVSRRATKEAGTRK